MIVGCADAPFSNRACTTSPGRVAAAMCSPPTAFTQVWMRYHGRPWSQPATLAAFHPSIVAIFTPCNPITTASRLSFGAQCSVGTVHTTVAHWTLLAVKPAPGKDEAAFAGPVDRLSSAAVTANRTPIL